MQDVRRVVEKLADAVAAEIAHDGATFRFGIGLDRLADGTGASTRAYGGNAAHQAFMGDIEQPLGGALDLADRIHAARVAVPAIDDIGDVDIDDVALAQRLVVGDAMTDDVIDRGTGGLGVAAVVQRRGQGAIVHAEFEDEAVDLVGGDARLNARNEFVEAARRHLAGLAHAFKTFRSVEPDNAGVFVGGRPCLDVSHHSKAFICSKSDFIEQRGRLRPLPSIRSDGFALAIPDI
ncbi:hypothetical protein D9M70_525810 [compost metagenome]